MVAGNFSSVLYWLAFIAYPVFLLFRRRKVENDGEGGVERRYNWYAQDIEIKAIKAAPNAFGRIPVGIITWMTWAAYELGMSGLWIVAVPWLMSCICQLFLVRPLRKIKHFSQAELLHHRFGLPAETLCVAIKVFFWAVLSAAELYAASLIMAPALKVTVQLMISICAVPLLADVWMNGFRSANSPGSVQFFIGAYFLLVILAAIGLTAHEAAVAQQTTIWEILKQQQILNSNGYPIDPDEHPTTLFAYASISFPLIILLALLPGWSADEGAWLAVQSAKSSREAYRGIIYRAVVQALLVVGPASLIGLLGLVVFPPETKGGVLVAARNLGEIGGYNVISACVNTYFVPWLKALLLFLVAAHVMNAVVTSSSICARSLTHHLFHSLLHRSRDCPEEKAGRMGRATLLLMTVVTVLLAEFLGCFGVELSELYLFSSSLLTSGVAVMLYAIWWKRANLAGAVLGGLSGVIGTIVFFLIEEKVGKFSWEMPLWDWFPGGSSCHVYCVVGLLCSVVGLIAGSFLGTPPGDEHLRPLFNRPVDV